MHLTCLLYHHFNYIIILVMSDSSSFKNIASFIFETGLLNNFKRSGFDFLGTGNQNIASHSFRASIISYVLAKHLKADENKAVLLALFHDIPETRTGDINHFQRNYTHKDEDKAVKDIASTTPELNGLIEFNNEFNSGISLEAKIAQDADVLELIFTLKEELDKGNTQAEIWINGAVNRLTLDESKHIAKDALNMKSYDWWLEILSMEQ